MKSPEGFPQNNSAQEDVPSQEEREYLATTFQNAAGEAYAKIIRIQQELRYNQNLTDTQRQNLESEVQKLAQQMETSNKIATAHIDFPRNDSPALDITDDSEDTAKAA
jgi:multidrug resistance efflux pump